jgi:hypothetical protein
MKTTLVTLAAAAATLVLSLPASAQDPTYDVLVASPTLLSRADVRADAELARKTARPVTLAADGEVTFAAYDVGLPLSRVQVSAQAREANFQRLALVPNAGADTAGVAPANAANQAQADRMAFKR